MFSHPPRALAAMPGSEMSLGDSVTYLISGFGIVMLTLLSLAIVCWLVGILFRRFPRLAEAGGSAEPKRAAPSSAAAEAGSTDSQVVVAIGAAVDQALGGRYRIKSVRKSDK